jgi:hypothetical protein
MIKSLSLTDCIIDEAREVALVNDATARSLRTNLQSHRERERSIGPRTPLLAGRPDAAVTILGRSRLAEFPEHTRVEDP